MCFGSLSCAPASVRLTTVNRHEAKVSRKDKASDVCRVAWYPDCLRRPAGFAVSATTAANRFRSSNSCGSLSRIFSESVLFHKREYIKEEEEKEKDFSRPDSHFNRSCTCIRFRFFYLQILQSKERSAQRLLF